MVLWANDTRVTYRGGWPHYHGTGGPRYGGDFDERQPPFERAHYNAYQQGGYRGGWAYSPGKYNTPSSLFRTLMMDLPCSYVAYQPERMATTWRLYRLL